MANEEELSFKVDIDFYKNADKQIKSSYKKMVDEFGKVTKDKSNSMVASVRKVWASYSSLEKQMGVLQDKTVELEKAYKKEADESEEKLKAKQERITSITNEINILRDEASEAFKDIQKATIKSIKLNKEYEEQFKDMGDEALKQTEVFKKAFKESYDARMSAKDNELKTFKEEQDEIKKNQDKTLKNFIEHVEAQQDAIKSLDEMKTPVVEILMEGAKEFTKPIQDLFEGNIPQALKSAADIFATNIEDSTKYFKNLSNKWASKLQAKAEKQPMGSAKGVGLGIAANSLKGFGKVMGALEKLAPAVGLIGTVVKTLIDVTIGADVAVKEFNKGMIAASGSGEYMGRNMGDVGKASKNLGKDLESFYNAAADPTMNNALATNKDEILSLGTAFANAGVSFGKQADIAKDFVKQGYDSTTAMRKLAETQIVYARQLGVSTDELVGFQAELMKDVGVPVNTITQSFQSMSDAANEAGMNSKTFFDIVRGVSADLSLYGLRIEDATKLLGKLGTVMSPKSAKEFMQAISGSVKSMDNVQKTKMVMLAGQENVGKIIEKDIKATAGALNQQLAEATGKPLQEIEKIYKEKGHEGLKEVVKTLSADKQGVFMEKVVGQQIKEQGAKKGPYGQGVAMAEASAPAQLEVMLKAMNRFNPGKDMISGLTDISAQLHGQLGIDPEKAKKFAVMAEAIKSYQNDLIKKFEAGDQATKDMLAKKGVTTKEGLQKMTFVELFDTMGADQKKSIEKQAETVDFQKQTATFQQSMQDKLENIFQFLKNEAYNSLKVIIEVLSGLLDSVGSTAKWVLGKGFDDTGMKKAQEALGKFKENEDKKVTEFRDAARKGGGALQLSQAQLSSEFEGKINKGISDTGQVSSEVKPLLDQILSSTGMGKSRGTNDSAMFVKDEMALKSVDDIKKDFAKQMSLMKPEDFAALIKAGGGKAPPMPGAPAPGGAVEKPPVNPDALKAAEETTDLNKNQLKTQEETQKSIDSLQNTMKGPGVVISKETVNKDMKKATEDATLTALRTALFEYAMLVEPDKVKAAVKDSGLSGALTAGDIMKNRGEAGLNVFNAPANATGGYVSGIMNGLATIRPAPGEGLASVGPGERILPAGGGAGMGGGTSSKVEVTLSLKDDLSRLIEAKAQEVVVAHLANQKYR